MTFQQKDFFVEIKLRKKKEMAHLLFHDPKKIVGARCQGNNFTLMGNFNVEPNDVTMKNFCQICSRKNVVKVDAFFKNPTNPIAFT